MDSTDRRTLPQFLRFAAIGGVCYLLGLLFLYVLIERLQIGYAIANLLGIVIFVVLGHALQRWHTFQSTALYWPELIRFAAVSALRSSIALLAIVVLVEVIDAPWMLANFLVTAAATLASFVVSRAYVFQRAAKVSSVSPRSSS